MNNVKIIKHQTIQAYNWLAETYNEEWVMRIDKTIAERFLSLLNPKDRLLDIGCGPGHYANYFNDQGFNVYAMDLSAGMIRQAKRHWDHLNFIQMDVQNLGFFDRCFDALWVCTTFAHIPKIDVPSTLTEVKRVLKNAGYLFINATVGSDSIRIESEEEMRGYGKKGRFYQRYINGDEFGKLLTDANFKVIDTIERTVFSNYNKKNSKKVQFAPKKQHLQNHWINYYCKLK